VVESWPARLVAEGTAGLVGSGKAADTTGMTQPVVPQVRGADGRQRWIRAVDLRPASGSEAFPARTVTD
jgi:hypothetical protein